MSPALLFSLLVVTAHASDLKQWQERDKAYKQNYAIESATGYEEGARLRAEGSAIRAARIAKLAATHAVTDLVAREEARASKVAEANADAAAAQIIIVTEQKNLAGQISADEAAAAYGRLFAARADVAAAAVKLAEAELELEQFKFDGQSALVDAGAIDAAVLPELQHSLDARKADVRAAEKLWELAKAARIDVRGKISDHPLHAVHH